MENPGGSLKPVSSMSWNVMLRRPFESTRYAAEPYRRTLAERGLVGSMSRRDNPYDNGKAESFMKTIKCKEVLPQ